MAAAPPAEVTARRGGMILPGGREAEREGAEPWRDAAAAGGGHRRAAESPAAPRAAGGRQVRRAAGAEPQPCPAGMRATLPSSAAERPPGGGGRSGITCCGGLASAALPRNAGLGAGAAEHRARTPSARTPLIPRRGLTQQLGLRA